MSTTITIKSDSFKAYWQLMRPANIVTAWADILLGCAAASKVLGGVHQLNLGSLSWLILATTGLYGGGVVFNDVFDAELDATERPERPIPSGRASVRGAIALGTVLLFTGIAAAMMVSKLSLVLAVIVALAALIYDQWSKHQTYLGPLNMGVCRGANLLLGISIVSVALSQLWFLALIPIIYIAAITAISQGEVHGGNKITGIIAIAFLVVVIGSVLTLGILPGYTLLFSLPSLTLFTALVVPPFIKATINPSPQLIQTAVKAGVLSLIVLDATISSGFTNWFYGLLILLLLPFSRILARLFPVT